jgi:hypothetical protein
MISSSKPAKTYLWLTSVLLVCLIGFSACTPSQTASGPGQMQSAAGTATALIQNAQATAMVMEAQAMATALVEKANAPLPSPTPQVTNIPEAQTTQAATLTPSPQPTSAGVQVVDVTTAAEGAYLMVEFRAPVRIAASWMEGTVYVIDENSGTIYNGIPSVGSIGPLFDRPKTDGRMGYIMFSNTPVPLGPGAMVTVVLGNFKQVHMKIQ